MPMKAATGTLFWPMKSDIASPSPVVSSFRTQKMAKISGTLVAVWTNGLSVGVVWRNGFLTAVMSSDSGAWVIDVRRGDGASGAEQHELLVVVSRAGLLS